MMWIAPFGSQQIVIYIWLRKELLESNLDEMSDSWGRSDWTLKEMEREGPVLWAWVITLHPHPQTVCFCLAGRRFTVLHILCWKESISHRRQITVRDDKGKIQIFKPSQRDVKQDIQLYSFSLMFTGNQWYSKTLLRCLMANSWFNLAML